MATSTFGRRRPGTTPATAAAEQPRTSSPDPSAVRFFDTAIVKINQNGDEVLSDTLGPGERLRHTGTDRYTATSANQR